MEFYEALDESDSTVILTHHNADIDAVGSAIALYEFFDGDAHLAVPDTVSKGARDLADGYTFDKAPDISDFDTLVIVDCPSSDQIKPLKLDDFSGKTMLIDHHSPGDLHSLIGLRYIDEDAKSTSELVYKLLKDRWEFNKEASDALICGIVADTSHLRLADGEQFQYISELLSKTESSYSKILSILSTPIDRSERIARLKAASRMQNYDIGGNIVSFSSVGSFEAASARSFLRMGSDIAIVFSIRDDEMRVSGRCRRELTEHIHLGNDLFSQIEDVLDGSAGGHDAAASGNGTNTDYDSIVKKMIDILEEVFETESRKL